ncbi:hypothetical protein Tco_0529437 [Tanacetum coccineum]
MTSQTRNGVVIDNETRQGLKDIIARIMREELRKLRNEMRNMVMANNSRIVVHNHDSTCVDAIQSSKEVYVIHDLGIGARFFINQLVSVVQFKMADTLQQLINFEDKSTRNGLVKLKGDYGYRSTGNGFKFNEIIEITVGFGCLETFVMGSTKLKVKCKYVTRNTGKRHKNEENADSYEGLRRNTYDSVTPMSHPSQRYGVTWLISYAVTYFMPTTWKASSALYGVTLYKVTYPFDYRVTLSFGSIAGGLDHVSPVIRLPIERGINSGTRIVIMEYLVNISKRHAFWSLNKDILKITILTTNTPYPSRKIRRICACTHQRPRRKQAQYAVSREDLYAVFKI